MKTKIFALAFTFMSSVASAQFNAYRLDFMRPACVPFFNPYQDTQPDTRMVCRIPTIEGGPRITETFVQASVGMPGRESTFLILVNTSTETNHVVIEYTIDGKEGTFYQEIYMRPKERYSVGLHGEPELSGVWNFSATVQFQKHGASEMVWYAAIAPSVEVDSKRGQVVQ